MGQFSGIRSISVSNLRIKFRDQFSVSNFSVNFHGHIKQFAALAWVKCSSLPTRIEGMKWTMWAEPIPFRSKPNFDLSIYTVFQIWTIGCYGANFENFCAAEII